MSFGTVVPLVTARALSGREFTYELPDGAGKGAVVSVPAEHCAPEASNESGCEPVNRITKRASGGGNMLILWSRKYPGWWIYYVK